MTTRKQYVKFTTKKAGKSQSAEEENHENSSLRHGCIQPKEKEIVTRGDEPHQDIWSCFEEIVGSESGNNVPTL